METTHEISSAVPDDTRGTARRYLSRLERYPVLPRERRPDRGIAALIRGVLGRLRLWRNES